MNHVEDNDPFAVQENVKYVTFTRTSSTVLDTSQEKQNHGNGKNTDTNANLPLSIYLTNFANEVSILGLKQAINPKFSLFRRFIWGLCVMGGMICMFYHIYNRFATFAGNPVSVNIAVHHKDSLQFPTVTICNNNVFNASSLSANNESSVAYMYPPHRLTPTPFANGVNWTDFHIRNGYEFENIYGGFCTWGTSSGSVSSCSAANFTPVVTEMGLCYQFNCGDTNLKTWVEGSSNGLTLHLWTAQEEALSSVFTAGYTVRVHNPHEFPEIRSRGLLVAPGATTQLSIKQARAQNLPSPYGNCRDGSLTYFREYSKVNCMAECNHKNIMQKCGCRLHYYPPVAGTRECSPYDVYTCVGQQLVIDSDEKAAALNCDCSEPCSGVTYQHGVTHSRISDSYANYSATITGKSPEYVKSNYVILKVYYSDLSYQETIQSASYPFLTLLADIGGALGLVLGMTMMTLVEVVDFCFQLCWLQFYKRKT